MVITLIMQIEQIFAGEQKHEADDELIGGHDDDVAPHLLVHKRRRPTEGLALLSAGTAVLWRARRPSSP